MFLVFPRHDNIVLTLRDRFALLRQSRPMARNSQSESISKRYLRGKWGGERLKNEKCLWPLPGLKDEAVSDL